MNKNISVNNTTNSDNFPFNVNLVDEDSLRLMTMQERAKLGTNRILKWGTINELTPEEWALRIEKEFERVQVETIISCAMMLEQDLPVLLGTENAELIGAATGNYLRTNMNTIVAGIEIEEDFSIDSHESGANN